MTTQETLPTAEMGDRWAKTTSNAPVLATAFGSGEGFQLAQRVATAMAASSIVPEAYRNNVPNCLIALEASIRIKCSPLAVMQNLHIIQGKPSWASTFVIASINSSGRFKPLQFRVEGAGPTLSCVAHTEDMEGRVIEGPPVTMKMAEAEGWLGKSGSKWKTMPELMIRYRAAAFFGRLYAPELMLGMHTEEETIDAEYRVLSRGSDAPAPGETKADSLKAKLAAGMPPEPHRAEPAVVVHEDHDPVTGEVPMGSAE